MTGLYAHREGGGGGEMINWISIRSQKKLLSLPPSSPRKMKLEDEVDLTVERRGRREGNAQALCLL